MKRGKQRLGQPRFHPAFQPFPVFHARFLEILHPLPQGFLSAPKLFDLFFSFHPFGYGLFRPGMEFFNFGPPLFQPDFDFFLLFLLLLGFFQGFSAFFPGRGSSLPGRLTDRAEGNGQNRALGEAHHLLGHGTEEEIFQAGPAPGADGDQFRLFLLRRLDDFLRRVSLQDPKSCPRALGLETTDHLFERLSGRGLQLLFGERKVDRRDFHGGRDG